MRKLPVYLVLDTSHSMSGEPIEAVKKGLQTVVSSLQQNPYALETVYLSIITFDSTARQIVPLTELSIFKIPPIRSASSTVSMGAALKLLADKINTEVEKPTTQAKGDWRPLVFIMVGCNPTDDLQAGLVEFKKCKTGSVVVWAVNSNVNHAILKQITDNVITANAATASFFFKWVSSIIYMEIQEADNSNLSNLPSTEIISLRKNMARRLPVYLLLDTSGSMQGDPIEAVRVGLQTMLTALRQDPAALETVWLSIITFDSDVKQLMPITELESFILPQINIPQSGATFLGKALELLCACYDKEVIKNTAEHKGDWMPLLFIMTDGSPSDLGLYREMIAQVKMRHFGNIVACAAGSKAKESYLKELANTVVSLDTTDSNTFKLYFKWVSDAINIGNRSIGSSSDLIIPPPPKEINIVI